MPNIDFIQEYRFLQPLADEARIEARQASFNEIEADARQNHARVADLTRLAFDLPYSERSESDEWFSTFMRNHNRTFDILHDRQEAANMATLVLKQRIMSGFQRSSLFVITAAFGGRRSAADKGQLITSARRGLAQNVRRVGQKVNPGRISSQKAADLTKAVATFDEETEGATKALVDALSATYMQNLNAVVSEANNIIGKIVVENARLLDEVNLLWWHIGGHSVLLDKPIDTFEREVKPFVVGADVATIVGSPLGPYGAYGVIRRALGPNPDEQIKISDALKVLKGTGLTDIVKSRIDVDQAMAPIHFAAAAALLDSAMVTATQFKKSTGLSLDTKLSFYEIALQVFHERLLMNDGQIN